MAITMTMIWVTVFLQLDPIVHLELFIMPIHKLVLPTVRAFHVESVITMTTTYLDAFLAMLEDVL